MSRTKRNRAKFIVQRDGPRCFYCARSFVNGTQRGYILTVEHLIPRCLHGSNTRDNCVVACNDCNGHWSQIENAIIQGLSEMRHGNPPRRRLIRAGSLLL